MVSPVSFLKTQCYASRRSSIQAAISTELSVAQLTLSSTSSYGVDCSHAQFEYCAQECFSEIVGLCVQLTQTSSVGSCSPFEDLRLSLDCCTKS